MSSSELSDPSVPTTAFSDGEPNTDDELCDATMLSDASEGNAFTIADVFSLSDRKRHLDTDSCTDSALSPKLIKSEPWSVSADSSIGGSSDVFEDSLRRGSPTCIVNKSFSGAHHDMATEESVPCRDLTWESKESDCSEDESSSSAYTYGASPVAKTGAPSKKKEFESQTITSSDLKLKEPLSPSSRIRGTRRRLACGQCTNCLRPDCQICCHCRDMKKYGGKGVFKQKCLRRVCQAVKPSQTLQAKLDHLLYLDENCCLSDEGKCRLMTTNDRTSNMTHSKINDRTCNMTRPKTNDRTHNMTRPKTDERTRSIICSKTNDRSHSKNCMLKDCLWCRYSLDQKINVDGGKLNQGSAPVALAGDAVDVGSHGAAEALVSAVGHACVMERSGSAAAGAEDRRDGSSLKGKMEIAGERTSDTRASNEHQDRSPFDGLDSDGERRELLDQYTHATAKKVEGEQSRCDKTPNATLSEPHTSHSTELPTDCLDPNFNRQKAIPRLHGDEIENGLTEAQHAVGTDETKPHVNKDFDDESFLESTVSGYEIADTHALDSIACGEVGDISDEEGRIEGRSDVTAGDEHRPSAIALNKTKINGEVKVEAAMIDKQHSTAVADAFYNPTDHPLHASSNLDGPSCHIIILGAKLVSNPLGYIREALAGSNRGTAQPQTKLVFVCLSQTSDVNCNMLYRGYVFAASKFCYLYTTAYTASATCVQVDLHVARLSLPLTFPNSADAERCNSLDCKMFHALDLEGCEDEGCSGADYESGDSDDEQDTQDDMTTSSVVMTDLRFIHLNSGQASRTYKCAFLCSSQMLVGNLMSYFGHIIQVSTASHLYDVISQPSCKLVKVFENGNSILLPLIYPTVKGLEHFNEFHVRKLIAIEDGSTFKGYISGAVLVNDPFTMNIFAEEIPRMLVFLVYRPSQRCHTLCEGIIMAVDKGTYLYQNARKPSCTFVRIDYSKAFVLIPAVTPHHTDLMKLSKMGRITAMESRVTRHPCIVPKSAWSTFNDNAFPNMKMCRSTALPNRKINPLTTVQQAGITYTSSKETLQPSIKVQPVVVKHPSIKTLQQPSTTAAPADLKHSSSKASHQQCLVNETAQQTKGVTAEGKTLQTYPLSTQKNWVSMLNDPNSVCRVTKAGVVEFKVLSKGSHTIITNLNPADFKRKYGHSRVTSHKPLNDGPAPLKLVSSNSNLVMSCRQGAEAQRNSNLDSLNITKNVGLSVAGDANCPLKVNRLRNVLDVNDQTTPPQRLIITHDRQINPKPYIVKSNPIHMLARAKSPYGSPSIPSRYANSSSLISASVSRVTTSVASPVAKTEAPAKKEELELQTIASSDLKLKEPLSSSLQNDRRMRRVACGECANCLRPDCQKCSHCLDMKKYGGKGRAKQRCVSRMCPDTKWKAKDVNHGMSCAESCALNDCHRCRYCLDRRSNGGPGRLRQACPYKSCYEHRVKSVVYFDTANDRLDFSALLSKEELFQLRMRLEQDNVERSELELLQPASDMLVGPEVYIHIEKEERSTLVQRVTDAGFGGLFIADIMDQTPTQGVTDVPQQTPTQGVTGVPQQTPTQGVTGVPQQTPTQGVTDVPQQTPTQGVTDVLQQTPTDSVTSDIDKAPSPSSTCSHQSIDVAGSTGDMDSDTHVEACADPSQLTTTQHSSHNQYSPTSTALSSSHKSKRKLTAAADSTRKSKRMRDNESSDRQTSGIHALLSIESTEARDVPLTLNFSHCPHFTDSSFRQLFQFSTFPLAVEHLYISETLMGDDSLRLIATCMKSLSTLSANQCPRVTDEGIKQLADRGSGSIKHLMLRYCQCLTSDSLTHIKGPGLANLVSVDLTGCARVMASDMLKFMTYNSSQQWVPHDPAYKKHIVRSL